MDEIFRWDSPTQSITKSANAHLTIGCATVEPGQAVTLLVGSANRDPDQFEHADELILDRQPNPHLVFGWGRHYCLGVQFVKAITEQTMAALLPLLPRMRLDHEPKLRDEHAARGYSEIIASIV